MDESGKPYRGVVRAYHMDARGTLRLGEDTTDAEGRYTIRYAGLPGIDTIVLRVAVFDAGGNLIRESEPIQAPALLEIV
ncbi:hypothetical protein, partial [Salmonella enterica]|uniref:hypothetical protein n=1 Tax=Salmonella enterica TaxID=28901 RepID=UPI003CF8EC90